MMKRATVTDNDVDMVAPDIENRVAFTNLETMGKKKEIHSIRPGQAGLVKSEYLHCNYIFL